MIRVVLADDHKIVRDGLRQILAMTQDIIVSCEFENGGPLLDCIGGCGVDLVIVDMSMPAGGVQLIEGIRKLRPDMPMLVLSMHNEAEVAAGALRAGANGYVTKDCDTETLLFAIRRVSQGERFIDPKLASSVLLEGENAMLRPRLTEREAQILKLLANGQSVTEIASALDLSVKTVSTHKTNMMQKLAIENNAALIRYAMMQGMV